MKVLIPFATTYHSESGFSTLVTIVTNPEYNGYKLTMNKIFHEVNKWFKTNLLTLNLKNSSLAVRNNKL
jgi:hypothetical protein